MRLTLLTLILCLGSSLFAQTVVSFREAPLQGSAQYFLNGSAFIEELDNGAFQFRLSNDYATNSGPDVQIFLTNNTQFSSPVNTSGALFIEDVGTAGGISHFSGSLTKPVPSLTLISQFDHVVFVCVQFGQLYWGHGSFGPATPVCATTTATLNETACNTYNSPAGNTYTTSGTYTETLVNAAGCDSIVTINLTVETFTSDLTANGLTLTANQANATYQWIDCNNNNMPIAGATGQSFTAPGAGSYAVMVSSANCSGTSACFTTTITNIDEDAFGQAFTVAPNPTHGSVTLNLGDAPLLEPVQITVVDLVGNTVLNLGESRATQHQLELRNLGAGVYFVAVQHQQERKVIKLLKQ